MPPVFCGVGKNWLTPFIRMSFNNPHPDDITQQLLRSVSFLLVLSVAGVIALLMVKPSSYWHGATGESNQAPLPCIKDPSMEM